jgi:hypothetical protein
MCHAPFVLLVLIAALPRVEQDKPPQVFVAGKTFHQVLTTTTQVEFTVLGMKARENWTEEYYASWTCIGRSPEGFILTYKVNGAKTVIEGKPVFINVPPINPLVEFTFLANNNLEITKTLDHAHLAEFPRRLKAAWRGVLEPFVDEKALMEMANPARLVLAVGIRNQRRLLPMRTTANVDLLGLGRWRSWQLYPKTLVVNIKGESVVVGVEGAIDNLTFAPMPDRDFKCSAVKTTTGNFSRVLHFHRETNRLEQTRTKLHLTGTFTIDFSGPTVDAAISIEQVTTIRTTDAAPWLRPNPLVRRVSLR